MSNMEFSVRMPLPVLVRVGDKIRHTSVRIYSANIGEIGAADPSTDREISIPEFLAELAETRVLTDNQKLAIRLTLGLK
jgi:hypothetical protein